MEGGEEENICESGQKIVQKYALNQENLVMMILTMGTKNVKVHVHNLLKQLKESCKNVH
jgi:hypothetical protein